MDLARSDELELTPNVCQVLLRSGDVMESLIEKARDRDNTPSDTMTKVLHELSVILDPGAVEEVAEPTAAAPSPEPVADVTEEEVEESKNRSVEVHFKPDSGFFRAGHDALKMIGAAKAHGLVKVELEGEILPLPEFTLDICTVSWRLHFETELDNAKLEEFFLVYEAAATWDILEDGGDATEEVGEPAKDAEPKQAAEPVKDVAPEAPAAQAAPKETTVQAKPAAPKADKPASAKKPGVSKSLRVELARVDRLVNLVGEIVITQAALAQRLGEAGPSVDLEVEHSVEAMSRQTRDLQESVMAIRAQPVKSVFSRMPRVVRDLADKLGKDVRLELSGEQTEVDTTVIEELAEPLTHMLRNSMDHGLEGPEEREAAGKPRTGIIKLAAEHRGERVIITIADDGRGINREMTLTS